jgi:DNA-directed RNA polymerase sigma subunit (sigma70/sigma32)
MASTKSSSQTMTSTEVRELLRTAAAKLSAREEKVVRMRTGATLPKPRSLARRGQEHPEARAELYALEIELMQKLQARAEPAAKAHRQPVRTKEKEKIIRALKRLK